MMSLIYPWLRANTNSFLGFFLCTGSLSPDEKGYVIKKFKESNCKKERDNECIGYMLSEIFKLSVVPKTILIEEEKNEQIYFFEAKKMLERVLETTDSLIFQKYILPNESKN